MIPTMPRHDSPPDETHPLDSTLDFMRLLWSIEHGLQRRSKAMEAERGITGPQRLVLRVVGRFPDLSAGELAQVLRLHPSTVTGILQRLVSRGLLSRTRDPGDSRRARLRLKAKAVRHTKSSEGTVEEAVAQALTRASASDVVAARRVLTAIGNALNQS